MSRTVWSFSPVSAGQLARETSAAVGLPCQAFTQRGAVRAPEAPPPPPSPLAVAAGAVAVTTRPSATVPDAAHAMLGRSVRCEEFTARPLRAARRGRR